VAEVEKLIGEIEELIKELAEVTPVHGGFYQLSAKYYKVSTRRLLPMVLFINLELEI